MAQKTMLSISGEKALEAELLEKDISFFKLDLQNPRFSHTNLTSEKEFEEEIWKESDIADLYSSILESKGLSEPVFAKSDGTVIEGNRRIVCLRKIKENYFEKGENIFPRKGYEKIPTWIVSKNVDNLDLDVLLARLHVSGKKEWRSLNQAEHIYNLRQTHKLTIDKIKKLIGMSRGKIHQKEWAFTETKKFLEKYPQESLNRYSFFEEAYKKKNLRSSIEKGEREQFYNWIVGGKFTGAKDIRQLDKIIDKPVLMGLFNKQGITKAFHEYQAKYEIKEEPFKVAIDFLSLLKGLSEKEKTMLLEDKDKVSMLDQLKKELNILLSKEGK